MLNELSEFIVYGPMEQLRRMATSEITLNPRRHNIYWEKFILTLVQSDNWPTWMSLDNMADKDLALISKAKGCLRKGTL